MGTERMGMPPMSTAFHLIAPAAIIVGIIALAIVIVTELFP
jgi:hypothetical protein